MIAGMLVLLTDVFCLQNAFSQDGKKVKMMNVGPVAFIFIAVLCIVKLNRQMLVLERSYSYSTLVACHF